MSGVFVYLTIFILGAIPLFEATFVVPIAILGGANLFLSLAAGISGNFLTIILVVIFSEKVKDWFMKDKASRRNQRAEGIWKKFGFHGFVLLGPILLSSHVSAIAAVSFGATRAKTIAYVTLSLIIWTLPLAILANYGVDFLGLEDMQFLRRYLDS
ncbi:small multi-drug export protein [Lacicoccus alkaliphilus]|uniref:Putative small multi-drug export protein n=1 Tax=Lacicoccus alkaliphilus DSM 16010 TaxID=1123231 RepID=A0A1M7H8U0_9BACL|nr:small multi-drug export protein [Salinicoccus alkaliphilus]SHM25002.1 Putative small multi-drug export protein [Salinicoccus alkaliphilus DSM 16010]